MSPTRIVATAISTLTLLTLLGLSTAASPMGHAVTAERASAGLTYANNAHVATNRKRANNGLPALRKNECLRQRALMQARRMAARGQIFHQDLGAVQQACGVGAVAENVAAGFPTGWSVVRAWMGSAGHRQNILSSTYRLMGIGAVRSNGTWYVAQVFGRK